MAQAARGTPTPPVYQPFPDVAARNGLQASIEVPLMVRALGLPRGGRVLEVGCGRGVALPVLARLLAPSRLVGLDVDASLLAAAEGRVLASGVAAELIRGDLRALPFDDASFDVVIDFGTCYHCGDAGRALREVARVLAPGGVLAHETRAAQMLAHPVRSFGRSLPWGDVPALRRGRGAGLWASRWRAP